MVHKLQVENSRSFLFSNETSTTKSKTFPQYLAAILATLSAFSMGITLSWTSAAIPMLQEENSYMKISLVEGSWVASLITLGAFFGAIPAGAIATIVGPKRTLQILSLPMFMSWITIAYSFNVWSLYAARFLVGLAIGAVSVAAPMYVAELAESKIRGTLGTFFQLQITAGILFEYILGGSIQDFRILALISSAVPLIFLITFSFMPESPVFMITKGNVHQARINLQWFRGECYNVDDEINRIQDNIHSARQNNAKITDLLNCRVTSRALVVSLGLMVFQQLSGINAVLFYTGNIFKESGVAISPNNCAVVVGAVQVAATYLSTVFIDRAGRKILLIISSSMMSLSLFVLGLYFFMKNTHDMSNFVVVPVISLAAYVVAFSIGFGPIPWIMMGELFMPKVKSMASSVSASFNWLLAFTVTKLFQNMLDLFGSANTFYIFSAICSLGCLFVVLMTPETKERSIDEIMTFFGGKNIEKENTINDDDKTNIKIC